MDGGGDQSGESWFDDVAEIWEEFVGLLTNEFSDYHGQMVWFAHCFLIGLVFRFASGYCCQKRKQPEDDGKVTVTPDQLPVKKSLLSSYLLWMCGGAFGLHHFYLNRLVHGLLVLWTGNLFGVGIVLDMFFMPAYVRSHNANLPDFAPMDKSKRSLLCRLPCFVLFLVLGVVGVVGYMPVILHRLDIVDIDRLKAQTEANPYETLGIPFGASFAEAKAAYRKESLRWHPDRNPNCGKECENKMSEVARAFELVKRKVAPPPEDRTWQGWLESLGKDWLLILETLVAKGNSS